MRTIVTIVALTIGLTACQGGQEPARGVERPVKVELAPAVVVDAIPTELGPATILIP